MIEIVSEREREQSGEYNRETVGRAQRVTRDRSPAEGAAGGITHWPQHRK